MNPGPDKRIFTRVAPADFVGRDPELGVLLSYAKGGSSARRVVVLAAPRAGASEILRQAYDRLFFEQNAVTPFYFEINPGDSTAQAAAHRFAYEFLLQTVAFRRRRHELIAASPDLDEIAELAAPSDGYWIDRAVEALGRAKDGRSFIRNCLGTPLRAAANGSPSFVMIDDVHLAIQIGGGAAFFDDLLGAFADSSPPVVFSGHRRFLFGKLQAEIVDLEPFAFSEAGEFVAKLAARHGISITDQTRDLIAVQLGGSAGHIASVIGSAAANGDELNNFDDVERVYTDEIFGGHLGMYFDEIIEHTGDRASALKLLSENLAVDSLPLSYWKRHLPLPEDEFQKAMAALHANEIVNVSSGAVTIDHADVVVCDYIRARSRLEIDRERRALAVGESLAENVKRGPALMARFYRQNAAIGLRELMQSFNGRQVSPVLLDYARFKEELKGADDDKIQKALKEDNDRTRLPHIVYTAHTGDLYPPLNEVCDIERSAVGIGFATVAKKDDITWLAAEVDSKLEAAADITEFWCDRLEMAAAHCGFSNFTTWLIAPEGFSPEAIDVLRARDALGASRRQVELLAEMLNAQITPRPTASADEYEFVVPMGGDSELLTANAVDEIAKRHDFPPKAINQIKTALVEACINAAEHSLSPDGKIRQKFIVDDDKISITVTNRGMRLADKNATAPADAGRRGWGMKLIKGLMDTVEVEQTDDGTRITMTKLLKHA
jgi:serine/threonine-protein kinase RsbW